MAEFVLSEPPTPTPVRVLTTAGLMSSTVHLTERGEKTLCGITRAQSEAHHPLQWWRPADPTCRKCISAVESRARIKREIR